MDFKATEEQEAIREATRQSSNSLLIPAYAGCSKTTTLALAGKEIRAPSLALAFNKRIAEELKPRFGGNFSIRTLNGLGMLAWTRANPGVNNWNLDDKKLGKLVTQTVKDRKIEIGQEQWAQLREFVRWGMMLGIAPTIYPDRLLNDDTEGWAQVADSLVMSDEDRDFLWETASEVLQKSITLAHQGQISFDDQVYASTILGGAFPKYSVVLTDETQDFSMLNFIMLQRALRTDGRLVAVGDEKQAIYAWRGAMGSAMAEVRRLRSEWTSLPLTMTFRCPKAVVARCQAHAPGFRAWHSNKDGLVKRLKGLSDEIEELEGGWTWEDVERLRPLRSDGGPGSLVVLCRNNAPLLKLAFRLLRGRIGVKIIGRDISGGLLALTKKLGPGDEMLVVEFASKLREWQDSEESLALANGQDEKVEGIRDRAECLRAVMEDGEVRDAGGLRRLLTMIFARTEGQVELSSIHKSKGLEWDLVLHLDPWRIPSKFARESGNEVAMEQELNLRYVAETRTRNVLVEADLEGFRRI